MPTYEYRCTKCGDFELVQRITEDALKKCPTCKGKVIRLLSAAPFHLKGSGWYKTDYASNGTSTNGSSSKKDSSSETAADSKSDSTAKSETASSGTASEGSNSAADSVTSE